MPGPPGTRPVRPEPVRPVCGRRQSPAPSSRSDPRRRPSPGAGIRSPPAPVRSRRRMPRTSVPAVKPPPCTKRVAGPKAEAVIRPATKRPGTGDSKSRSTSGEPSGRAAGPARSSSSSGPSRSRRAVNPVAAMTWPVSGQVGVPSPAAAPVARPRRPPAPGSAASGPRGAARPRSRRGPPVRPCRRRVRRERGAGAAAGTRRRAPRPERSPRGRSRHPTGPVRRAGKPGRPLGATPRRCPRATNRVGAEGASR